MANFLKSRSEFERNLSLVREGLLGRTIKISQEAAGLIKGINRVRLSPNMRIDFLTVDESARLFANTTAQMLNNKPTDADVDT